MGEDVAIKVENVSKDFILPHKKRGSLKSIFLSPFSKYEKVKQHALSDISFEVKKGEFFGIIGRNGSGKSTLLKCLAGVYTPNQGNIEINGSLVPFIELGVGFDPELSGRDNVYLNGSLLGFSRKEIDAMYKEIVDFAELEQFMDQKLKNYSSGMQVRLAFSVAIQAKSDILLLDEVLAVGDSAFQQKCNDYFATVKNSGRTIILVSHNMQAVERFCDKALLIEDSEVKEIGNSSTIAAMYENMFLREKMERINQQRKNKKKEVLSASGQNVEIKSVNVIQKNKKLKEVNAKEDFEIELTLVSKKGMKEANVGINIKNQDRIMLISTDTLSTIGNIELPKNKTVKISYKLSNILTNGLYSINIGVVEGAAPNDEIIFREENAQEFIIVGSEVNPRALIYTDVEVKLT